MSASWKQLLLQTLLLVISCRHINTKTSGATPAPLPPSTPAPTDVRSVDLTGKNQTEEVVVLNPISLTLECNWTENHNNQQNITGYWKKDGVVIENSNITVPLVNKKYNLKREFNIANEGELGNYSCIFESGGEITFILAAPRVGEVKDKPIVSYLRDTGVMQCKMEDTKPMPNDWHWFKGNGTEKINATKGRYEIHNEKRKTRLMVHNLTDADAGVYYCGAVYAIGTTLSRVEMKVITIYEPLKPFIAIVVEVIILVAAILLYERSRSKAGDNATGNKVDTDQTNTPTQEENSEQEGGSAMRQRKV